MESCGITSPRPAETPEMAVKYSVPPTAVRFDGFGDAETPTVIGVAVPPL